MNFRLSNLPTTEVGVKAVGRLLVVVMEGENLADRDRSGKIDQPCEMKQYSCKCIYFSMPKITYFAFASRLAPLRLTFY